MERAYTVKEIDELRRVVKNRLTYGYSSGPQDHQMNQWFYTPSSSQLEEQLRTYMLAGLTAKDLIEEDKAR